MWSEFDLKLIAEVQRSYRIRGFLSPCTWTVIGKKLHTLPMKCKSRWKSIRDMYVKVKKKWKDGKITHDRMKYLDERLSFIDSTRGCRRRRRKNSEEAIDLNLEISSDSDVEDATQNAQEPKSNLNVVIDVEEQDLGVTTFVTQDMIESLLKKKTNEADDYDNNGHLLQAINTMSDNLAIAITKHTLSNGNDENLESAEIEETFTAISAPVSELTQTLENHEAIDEIESISDIYVKDENEKKIERVAIDHINRDNIDTPSFFREIGDYVANHFSVEKQKDIRLKICSMLQDNIE